MKTILPRVFLLGSLVTASPLFAQPDFRWVRFQDGYGKDDVIEDVAVDPAGNIYVAGWTVNPSNNADYYIAKYDPSGNRRWYHLYDNGGDDFARSIAVRGGRVYVTGTSRSGTGFGANNDVVSFLLDTAGTVIPGNANALRFDYGGMGRDDAGLRVIPAPETAGGALFHSSVHADSAAADTFYVAGTHKDTLSQSDDLLLLRYAGDSLLGTASYHGPGDETLAGVAPGRDGALYLGATSHSGGADPSYSMVTVRFEPDLTFGWERTYSNAGYDILLGIAADASGVYVTGTSASVCEDPDVVTIGYTPDGTRKWATRAYDCFHGQVGSGGILTDDRSVYAAGYHANGSQYFALDKSDGTIRFQGDSPIQSLWVSIVESYDGNIYCGGHRLLYDMPYDAVHVVRFDSLGHVGWDELYDASGSGDANAVSKMVSGGPDSSLVLVGSVTTAGQRDMMIVKYGVGESMLTAADDAPGIRAAIPGSYELLQNYPNPFNSSTMLTYRLPEAAEVSLKIYDVLGREVSSLADGRDGAGEKTITFEAGELPSGIYFCRFSAGGHSFALKLVLLR